MAQISKQLGQNIKRIRLRQNVTRRHLQSNKDG